MHGNEAVTNRCSVDGTLDCGRRSVEYFGSADWRWIVLLLIIFSLIQKRLAKRYKILDRVTLKQDKTDCGRLLITDPMAHVVTDADEVLEENQPSGVERIKTHVSLTPKYGCRVLLVYTGYSFGLHRHLDKEIKLLSTEATFGFY